MKFLIQTINNKICYDFANDLIRSLEILAWKEQKNANEYYVLYNTSTGFIDVNDLEKYKDYCPIGSIEFVHLFYLYLYNVIGIKPINVPGCLFNNAGRLVINYSLTDDGDYHLYPNYKENEDRPFFVKSMDVIKHEGNGVYKGSEIFNIKDMNNIQISTLSNFISEYRCFIFENKLVGLKHYIGDFTLFPNIKTINRMIEKYKNDAPVAYTLDVGIQDIKNTTSVIEVHNFYACGTYGFNDMKLPYMFWRWHKEFLSKLNK